MRRNLGIGLILGIALLMLVPVYARAQMGLTLTGNGIVDVSGTVVNLSADPGQLISFSITSSLTNPTFTWLAYPPGATGVNTANFSWNTTGVSPGPYMAAFQASAGGELEQLVAIMTINYSSGGSGGGSTDTVSVSFSSAPTTGTSGQTVSFTASGSATSCSGTLQYYFSWGDGSNTGWVTAATQSHTYSPTTTTSYNVTVQAKCPTDNATSPLASATISIQGSGGGGGTGSKTNPILLNQTSSVINGGNWGYTLNSTGTTSVATGTRTYFEFIPSWACQTTKYFWIYVMSSANIQIYFARQDSNGNFLSGSPGTGTDESSLGGKVAQFAVQALRYSGGLEQYKWLIGIDNQTGVSVPIYIWIAPVCQ